LDLASERFKAVAQDFSDPSVWEVTDWVLAIPKGVSPALIYFSFLISKTCHNDQLRRVFFILWPLKAVECASAF
jgi:hypothetical protein